MKVGATMTTKDIMYLLLALIVLYITQWDLKDEYEWYKFMDHIFFLGERE